MKKWIATLLFLAAPAFAQTDELVAAPSPSPPPYRWGLLTSIMVPQPIAVGVLAVPSYNPDLAYYLEGGYLRFGFGNNKTIKDWSAMAGVRYRPLSNWLVLGAAFGYRNIGATADISGLQTDGAPLASQAILNLNTFFFALFVGGQWHLSQNVVFGVDLGIQASVFSWGNVTILPDPDSTDNTDLTVDDEDAMRRVSSLPLPQIALIRFIWYL